MTKVNEVRLDVLEDAVNKMEYADGWNCRLVKNREAWRENKVIRYQVNWACIGATDPADARTFISQLGTMTCIADMLNRMDIEVETDEEDTEITDGSKYREAVNEMRENIDNVCIGRIQDFLEGGK